MQELSALLNEAHQKLVPPWQTPSWFKLFRKVDSDGSGLISYDEFVEMVRTDLNLSARSLPEMHIRMAWLALDTDGSGYLSSGEFGAFMRLAQPHPADRAAARRGPPRSSRAAHRAPPGLPSEFHCNSIKDARQLRAQTDAKIERDLIASRTRYLLGPPPAPAPAPQSADSSVAPIRSAPLPHSKGRADDVRNVGRSDDVRDVEALQYQLALAQAQVRRLEQEAQGAREESESLATLLAHASQEELVKAVGALPPARRQLLRGIFS